MERERESTVKIRYVASSVGWLILRLYQSLFPFRIGQPTAIVPLKNPATIHSVFTAAAVAVVDADGVLFASIKSVLRKYGAVLRWQRRLRVGQLRPASAATLQIEFADCSPPPPPNGL